MKKLLFVLFVFSALVSRAQNTATPSSKADPLVMKELGHDFGKIQQGRPVTYIFEITNGGTEPLRIENVQASCGCTTPEWSYDPVKPGGTTRIKVGYNSASEGAFQKTVTISYNGNMTRTLTISGNVFKAPATSAPSNPSIALLKTANQ